MILGDCKLCSWGTASYDPEILGLGHSDALRDAHTVLGRTVPLDFTLDLTLEKAPPPPLFTTPAKPEVP